MKDRYANSFFNLLNLSNFPRSSSSSINNHANHGSTNNIASFSSSSVEATVDDVIMATQQQQELELDGGGDLVGDVAYNYDLFSNDNNLPEEQKLLLADALPSWADIGGDDDGFHPGFNVLVDSKLMTIRNQSLPTDANEPWYPGSLHTKLQFCELFQKFVAEEGLTVVASNKLLNLLKVLIPQSNLPFYDSNRGNVATCLDRYVINAEKRTLTYECCINGDFVFVGCLYDKLLYCPKCGEERYYPCSSRLCQYNNVDYESCTHDRTARCTISYRPMLPLIKDLLSFDLFISAINYKHFNPHGILVESLHDGSKKGESTIYSDVLDGESARFHLRAMQRKAAPMEAQGMVAINLLLGYNYDGCQPFSTKAVNFWPMTLSILNLPPNLRKKPGMGMFLLSIYHLSTGETYVEDFLHRDCFVKELLLLYDGFTMEVNDKSYFVQARLICHGYDTKAAEHVLRVQASGSLAGCPFCRLVTGSRKNWAGTVNFTGHRYLLPLNHFLRSRGQSQQCCPIGYYSINAPASLYDLQKVSHDPPLDRGIGLGFHNEYERKLSNLQPLCCNAADTAVVKEFLRSSRDAFPFRWYHRNFLPEDFKGSLYYHHLDYREQKEYRRVSNDEYIRDGKLALQTGAPVNGVKGLWQFRFLPYANFATQVNWDPFHTLMNVAKNVISTWKGTRPFITDNLVEYCKYTQSHPELWQSTTRKRNDKPSSAKTKWELPVSSVDELHSLDRYFDALLVPRGYSKDFEVKAIFTQTGYVKGYTYIQFIEVVMDYFVYAVLRPNFEKRGYPEELMKYLVLLSEDFASLLCTNPISDGDIKDLYYRIVELVELHHGLYPTTEALIVIHQLVDLPHHIRELGPLRNWWTLPGERFMSAVKDSLPSGGRSYVTTVLKRHINSELQDIKNYNSCENYTVLEMQKLSITDSKRHVLYPLKLFNITEEGTNNNPTIIYCERLTKLMHHDGSLIHMTEPYEFSCYLYFLVCQARNLCGSFQEALQRSPLFRLYCSFDQHNRSKLWTDMKIEGVKDMDDFTYWLTVMTLPTTKHAMEQFGIFSYEMINDSLPYQQLHISILSHGFIYQSDWEYCCDLIDNESYRKLPGFSKCIANGVEFCSRGMNCRETQRIICSKRWGQQRFNTRPSNPVNNSIAEHCGIISHYSSWCRVMLKCYSDASDADEVIEEEEFEFGQLNCFFRSKLPPGDPIIDDIPVASISVRKVERRGRNLFAVNATDNPVTKSTSNQNYIETSLKPDVPFCAVYNIYPTPIIVAAMDKDMKPIMSSAIVGRKKETVNKIHTLLFLQMFRHRTIKFFPTFPDIVSTMKVLTSSSNDRP